MTDLDDPKEWDNFNKEMDKREATVQDFLLDWLTWSVFSLFGLIFVILFSLIAYAIAVILAHSGILNYLLITAAVAIIIGLSITVQMRKNK